MTIRKGDEWGAAGAVPNGTPLASNDRALFELVNGEPLPRFIAIAGGDLARTVSASAADALQPGSSANIAPIDLGVAVHDGGTHRFASHAVARRSWWRGEVLVVSNAQFLGPWDVASRSHPNDGLLDVTEVSTSMTMQQRWAARSRLRTASHLPHPSIRTARVRARTWEFDRPLDLWLDGVRVGRTARLEVRVLADATSICF